MQIIRPDFLHSSRDHSVGVGGGRRGFALVVALGLMGFLVLLLVALAALVQVESRHQTAELRGFEARQNALLGLRLAMAQLQQEVGVDTRVTARADILTPNRDQLVEGKRYWTGVWRTDSEGDGDDGDEEDETDDSSPVWLVSSSSNTGDDPEKDWLTDTERVTLVTFGGTDVRPVQVGNVPIMTPQGANGGFAYWVGDEGVKAKINLVPEGDADADANRYLALTSRRFGFEQMAGMEEVGRAFDGDSVNAMDLSTLARLASFPQIELLSDSIAAAARDRFFDMTTHSYGVLANTRQGGLRRDLTVRLGSTDPLGGDLWDVPSHPAPGWEIMRRFYTLSEQMGTLPADELPVLPLQRSHDPEQLGSAISWTNNPPVPRSPALMPILAYAGLTTGVMAMEEDWGDPEEVIAFRLIVTMKPVVVLWNPYDVAIESDIGYVHYFEADSSAAHTAAPFIRIENHFSDTGAMRHIQLAALMPDHPEFERPYWTIGDYNLRTRGPRFSIRPTTLLPGEVAVFSLPSSGPFEFIYHDEVDEDIFGSLPAYARGGPYLERGFRPHTYVWVPIHGMPIGSSGSISGTNNWQGTTADLGLIAFLRNGEDSGQDDDKRVTPDPIDLWVVDTSRDENNNIVSTYRKDQSDVEPKGETKLSFSQPSAARVRSTLYQGRLLIESDGDGGAEDNFRIGQRHKLLASHLAPSQISSGFTRDFATADDFEMFMTLGPRDFSSWKIGLSTPVDQDRTIKLLSHYNVRIPISAGLNSVGGAGWNIRSPIYSGDADGGLDVSPIFSEDISVFPPESLREVSYSDASGSSDRTIGPILFHVPRHELLSVGQFMHLDLSRNVFNPTYVVGNSIATPWLGADRIINAVELADSRHRYAIADQSYFTNEALWDDYFFSSVRSLPNPPLNPRLRYIDPTVDAIAAGGAELAAAAALVIDGPFNVNSTSVEAWKTLLSSLNQTRLDFGDAVEFGGISEPQQLDSPFPRSAYQSLFGAERSFSNLEFETWRSIPELSEEQVDAIARHIVFELRSRGRPFHSLAEFINREPFRQPDPDLPSPTRDPRMMGVMQRALNADYDGEGDLMDGEPLPVVHINPRGFSSDQVVLSESGALHSYEEAALGLRAEAVPGYLMQADIFQALGPIIAVRSDTFIVRAYGSASGATQGDGPQAQAWCEAVVQRLPEYVDEALAPGIVPEEGSVNDRFGRRFRVVSFRWLKPDEI